ncbi:FecCD family ABC transporter permease [Bifidobacterium subtile]|jgi:iron complex transport system permease protein|uniref:ABC transporter, permease protein, probably Coelichelin uptake porter (Iron Chelate Uptake) n=1 Tax=Bifidobacterium subtile TaxID=77635 RepID=A0A087DTS0_9BIFI|nr:iron chelate uptake ABC transporter family permease subunit [Bifidobacterium subtile]KFI98920.1 ABC transporter, permease protein, probably Coelichelin uptake porter (Iron Chelate Uptake) [Bifidobacterium subtile]QOL36392.1 iron chelate uptake ABC transporter family permease subunit [Bifidobacterium subtile]
MNAERDYMHISGMVSETSSAADYYSASGASGNGATGLRQPPQESDIALNLRWLRRKASLRSLAISIALAALLFVLFFADLIFGHQIYAVGDVLAVIAGRDVPGMSFVIGELRLPRVIVGALCGIAFGMAGASFQHMLRNVMASPDIIGITAGANTTAVFGIIVLGASGVPLSLLAVAGGLATAALVAWLAWNGAFAPNRLILMGIGVAAALNAVSSWMLIRGDQWDIQAASRWLTGSLASAQWPGIPPLLTTVLACGAALLLLNRRVDVLRFGSDVATGLGVRVNPTQGAVIIVAVLLLSVATAASGPISFISFLAGPIAAQCVGPRKPAIAQAGLIGACVVLASDIVAQHVPPTQLPVGVITSIIGGPVLVILMIRMTRRQEF